MVELITNVNSAVNGFVWGIPMLVLLVGTGILMTALTKFFQLSHIGHWFKSTIGGIFHDKHITKHTDKEDQSISQFQSLCTALAATIGTGNIVGVASALISGGPGAIFWMWIVAFFGMMTNYSENVLGIYYRRKNERDEWCGGAMYYLKDGLGSYKGFQKIGAVLASDSPSFRQHEVRFRRAYIYNRHRTFNSCRSRDRGRSEAYRFRYGKAGALHGYHLYRRRPDTLLYEH